MEFYQLENLNDMMQQLKKDIYHQTDYGFKYNLRVIKKDIWILNTYSKAIDLDDFSKLIKKHVQRAVNDVQFAYHKIYLNSKHDFTNQFDLINSLCSFEYNLAQFEHNLNEYDITKDKYDYPFVTDVAKDTLNNINHIDSLDPHITYVHQIKDLITEILNDKINKKPVYNDTYSKQTICEIKQISLGEGKLLEE